MVVGTAVGLVAGIASTLLVTATIRPDVVIALVVGVPSAIGLLRVRARSVTTDGFRQSRVICSVGHRTEGKSGSSPVVAKDVIPCGQRSCSPSTVVRRWVTTSRRSPIPWTSPPCWS